MKQYIVALAVSAALAGCDRSVEEICAESDQLLKETTGSGFGNSGWRGCLSQTAAQAEMDLKAHRGNLAAPIVRRVSRAELEKELNGETIAKMIARLGMPSYYSIRTTKKTFVSPNGPQAGVEISVEEFSEALASVKTGIYNMTWVGPYSQNAIGIDDDEVTMLAWIRDGEVKRQPSITFPQNWIDRLSPF